jgi:arylsulfatase
MVISWPGHITDKGGIRNQFAHVIDIVPTASGGDRRPRTRHGAKAD